MTFPGPHDRSAGRRGTWSISLLVFAALLGSLLAAIATAGTDQSFGPNEARYEVTLDKRLVVDLGPLGTIQLASPAPSPVGIRVVVGEIPAELQTVGSGTGLSSLTSLASDADQYLQYFSNLDEIASQVTVGLAQDAARRWALYLLGIGVVVLLARVVVGRTRTRDLYRFARTWGSPIALVIIGAVVVGGAQLVERPMPEVGQRASVLAGTSLADARITGRLGGAVNTLGGAIVNAYRDNETYYADANRRLDIAWQQRDLADAFVAPLPTDMLTADDDIVTMLVVSDIHCNTGMSPLIGTAVERSGATIVLDAGDATIDGTSVEKICVTSLMNGIGGDATTVFVAGNHDSPDTAAQFDAAGAVVLHGHTQTVEGVTILGDSDPHISRTGQPTRLVGDLTADELSDQLTAAACDDSPDILLIHDPRIGEPVLDSGCVPYQISGHLHTRVGPAASGAGVLYVSGSTAGATKNQLTVGPLHGTAAMTVLRYDLTTKRMLDYRLVGIAPNRTATVGPRIEYPVPGSLGQ